VRKSDGRTLLKRTRDATDQAAEWASGSGARDWKRGWKAGADELRFSFWLSRVHARAGRLGAALLTPPEVLRRGVAGFAAPLGSSAFASQAELELLPDGVIVRAPLGFRGGAAIPGTALERRYQVDGEGLVVNERLVTGGSAQELSYRRPAAAQDLDDSGTGLSYRLA